MRTGNSSVLPPPVASSYARRRMYLQVIHTFIYADVTLDENVITVMRSWISQSADFERNSMRG